MKLLIAANILLDVLQNREPLLMPSDLNRAAASRWDDFEDAVQSATAERIGADRHSFHSRFKQMASMRRRGITEALHGQRSKEGCFRTARKGNSQNASPVL